MYTVVIGVDDNIDRALACARAVADLPGAASETRATVVHAFPDESAESAGEVASVRAVTDRLEARGIEFDVVGAIGDPADRLLAVAGEKHADLVVLSGRKRSPAGKALFGSVSQTVILNADRPVMIVGAEAE